MKDQQIYSSFYFSLGLHTFFLIAVIAYVLITGSARKMSNITVSLVQSPVRGVAAKSIKTPTAQKEEPEREESKPSVTSKPEPKADTARDRIAAMQAKKRALKSASQRRQVDISKSGAKVAGAPGPQGGADSYEGLVGGIIQKNWYNADFLNRFRNYSAIINIRIARNGEITILGWEKKSGSALFDREALRALNNSNPLPPPPGEMEIGVNFDPQKGR